MQVSVKIDKHIPPPPDIRGRPRKYPWKELEVGDSFLFEGKTCPLHYWQMVTRYRYTSRFVRLIDDEVKQYRVWRVE